MLTKDINKLIEILGGDKSSYILNQNGENQTDIDAYLTNYRAVGGVEKGNSPLVLLPKTTEQVSELLKYCNENKIKVFTQGGNTGLVGGSIPDETGAGVVISTKRMNQVISEISENSQTVKLQAGVIIDTLNQKADEFGLFCSIKHGGTGSSNIGGNIATNSGGANALKYGVTKDNVVGLTVVTASGDVLTLGGNLKDTTGINLRDVFIGSEGTLGIITEAEIKLHQKPRTVETLLIAFDEMAEVDRFFTDVKRNFGPQSIEAFEYMNNESYNLAIKFNEEHLSMAMPFLAQDKKHYLLVDVSSFDKSHEELQEKLMEFLDSKAKVSFEGKENASGYVDLENVMLPTNNSEKEIIWMAREHCSDASKACSGPNGAWFDDCVPFDKVDESIKLTEEAMQNKFPDAVKDGHLKVIAFGHRADGNIHVHIIQPEDTLGNGFNIKDHIEEIEDIRLGIVKRLGGNPFAEHGVGTKLHRMEYIEPEVVGAMAKIKESLDPNNILNPGRVIPEQYLRKERSWSQNPQITDRHMGGNIVE